LFPPFPVSGCTFTGAIHRLAQATGLSSQRQEWHHSRDNADSFFFIRGVFHELPPWQVRERTRGQHHPGLPGRRPHQLPRGGGECALVPGLVGGSQGRHVGEAFLSAEDQDCVYNWTDVEYEGDDLEVGYGGDECGQAEYVAWGSRVAQEGD